MALVIFVKRCSNIKTGNRLLILFLMYLQE